MGRIAFCVYINIYTCANLEKKEKLKINAIARESISNSINKKKFKH
jgi:hypothetical protein